MSKGAGRQSSRLPSAPCSLLSAFIFVAATVVGSAGGASRPTVGSRLRTYGRGGGGGSSSGSSMGVGRDSARARRRATHHHKSGSSTKKTHPPTAAVPPVVENPDQGTVLCNGDVPHSDSPPELIPIVSDNDSEQKVVISKMSLSAMFPWRLLFVLVVTVVSGILLYDINLHGSFQASKSGRLLNDVGLLAVCEHGWTRTKTYSGKFYKWLEDNIPYYYASFVEIADPYVKLFWEKLYIVGAFLADLSKDLRLYLHRKVPGILQWINDHAPALLTKASLYIWDAWTYIKQFSLIIWSNTLYYSHHVGIWLQEYVFTGKLSPENLQRYTLDTVETVQQYTLAAYHWVSHQIGGTAAGK